MDRSQIEKISKALADETRLRIFEAISACKHMNCGEIVSMRGVTPALKPLKRTLARSGRFPRGRNPWTAGEIRDLVCGISRKLEIRQPHTLIHDLICSDVCWSFESLGAAAGHIIVLIHAVAAHT